MYAIATATRGGTRMFLTNSDEWTFDIEDAIKYYEIGDDDGATAAASHLRVHEEKFERQGELVLYYTIPPDDKMKPYTIMSAK